LVVVVVLQAHALRAESFHVPARGAQSLAYVTDCFALAISSNVIA
jgi:hypothetical protein